MLPVRSTSEIKKNRDYQKEKKKRFKNQEMIKNDELPKIEIEKSNIKVNVEQTKSINQNNLNDKEHIKQTNHR